MPALVAQSMTADPFSDRLLDWFKKHGRRGLPWQLERNPYRVWVSEIMLQQTQVTTVIPYYRRFILRFPDVLALAGAKQDEVLHHWTGLGYYARARNLHKAAHIVAEKYAGQFPDSMDALIDLPGIGRSTAGAILSLACGKRYPILDGNVRRVLARYYAVDGWRGEKQVEKVLWDYAEWHTPYQNHDKYTQAIMDLGSTVCTRRRPRCEQCPVSAGCIAAKTGRQHDYPQTRPRAGLPERQTVFAIIENDAGEILLERRPPSGVWGGLWCFPEIGEDERIPGAVTKRYGYIVQEKIEYPCIKHTFSHFRLLIRPVHFRIKEGMKRMNDAAMVIWTKSCSPPVLGFPAPVVAILQNLNKRQ